MKKKLGILGLILLVGLIVYYFIYTKTGWGIDCPIHKYVGIYCPGCGITRMFFSIFELKIGKAFMYNQYLFILLVLSFIYLLLKYVFKVKISINKKYFYIIFIVSLIVWTIIRNIPYFSNFRPY